MALARFNEQLPRQTPGVSSLLLFCLSTSWIYTRLMNLQAIQLPQLWQFLGTWEIEGQARLSGFWESAQDRPHTSTYSQIILGGLPQPLPQLAPGGLPE